MADYYVIPTNIGEAKMANALALGIPLAITELALGDGEGEGARGTPLPNPEATALVSERRRAPINSFSVDPNNDNVLIAEQVIPETAGGWWIREMGLFDEDGDMIFVCNTPPTYKPQLSEGSGRTQVVRMASIVTNTEAVTLKVDPSVVLATRSYVDGSLEVQSTALQEKINERVRFASSVTDLENLTDPEEGQHASVSGEESGIYEYKDGAWQLVKTTTEKRILKSATPGPSLVDKLHASANLKGLYVRAISGGIAVGVVTHEKWVSEYRFLYDTDNLLLLRGVDIAPWDEMTRRKDVILNGSFNETNAPATYTTTPGDSIEFTFTGSSFKFARQCETRGGYWRFNVINASGAVIKSADVSCYAESGGVTIASEVVKDLPYATYTVKAVFQGDDPSFPPSSAPSRGYVFYNAADPDIYPINLDTLKQIDEAQSFDAITRNSIPDFAIRARPSGASYNSEWVPSHAGLAGVSTNIFIKILVNGKIVNQSAGSVPDIEFQEIETFEIVQSMSARNPNGSDGTMWTHYITHSIGQDGKLRITQSMRVQQDTEVGKGYFAMLPVESSPLELGRLVLNNRFVKSPIPLDGSQDTFGNDVTSAAFLGEFEPGKYYGCAIDISSLQDAVSYDRKDYEPDIPGLVTYRTDNVAKLYWTFLDDVTIKAGDVFSHQSTISVIAGIVQPNVEVLNVG